MCMCVGAVVYPMLCTAHVKAHRNSNATDRSTHTHTHLREINKMICKMEGKT